jgi:hypothetical protein
MKNAVETIDYKGFEIEIHLDSDYSNPFEDWDCEYPLMCTFDSGIQDYSKGTIDTYLCSYLSSNQITRHMNKVLEMINWTKEDFDFSYPLGEWSKSERQDQLSDLLSEWICERLENRASFCSSFGIKHYYGSSCGYSQGDYSKVFICWTPEFGKVTGHEYKDVTEESLKSTKELFDAWAWGDVYGYNVDGLHGVLGSCWGYYGNDHNKSGLLEAAKDEIDCHLNWAKEQELKAEKKRQGKIKAMIKNQVPLQYRTTI